MTSILLPGIHDTQCGFKLFRRATARAIFENCQLDGLAFDVEVLLEARRLGYKIVQISLPWTEGKESRIHPLRDGIKMARDLISLARRYRISGPAKVSPSLPL